MRFQCWLPVLLAACGSDPDGTPDAMLDPTVLRVAGEYPTHVELLSSDCSGISVMSRPTTVRHEPGATTLCWASGLGPRASGLGQSGHQHLQRSDHSTVARLELVTILRAHETETIGHAG